MSKQSWLQILKHCIGNFTISWTCLATPSSLNFVHRLISILIIYTSKWIVHLPWRLLSFVLLQHGLLFAQQHTSNIILYPLLLIQLLSRHSWYKVELYNVHQPTTSHLQSTPWYLPPTHTTFIRRPPSQLCMIQKRCEGMRFMSGKPGNTNTVRRRQHRGRISTTNGSKRRMEGNIHDGRDIHISFLVFNDAVVFFPHRYYGIFTALKHGHAIWYAY